VSAKTILIFLGGLVLLAGGFAVWLYWFSPPHVRLSTQRDQVLFENVILGEYYLGFEEIIIRDAASGQTVLHARRDKGEEVDRLSFRPGLNVTPPLWTVMQPKNSDKFNLLPGIGYELTLWGNNGFARINKWSAPLLVPSTPSR